MVHPGEADALDWAQRNGINPNDLRQILAKVSEGNRRLEILPHQINIGQRFDRGSFGSICLAEYKGQTVVIKRVSKVIVIQLVDESREFLHASMQKLLFFECLKDFFHFCTFLLKIIRSFQDTAGGLAQTVRNVLLELSALAPLAHPHIVSFKGMLLKFPRAGDPSGEFELGLVFEFCDGGNLHARMFAGNGHHLTYDDRIRFAREIAEAMAYVHGLNIIHRDLRCSQPPLHRRSIFSECSTAYSPMRARAPAALNTRGTRRGALSRARSSRNILLTGPNLSVRVSDFGLARKYTGDWCATRPARIWPIRLQCRPLRARAAAASASCL